MKKDLKRILYAVVVCVVAYVLVYGIATVCSLPEKWVLALSVCIAVLAGVNAARLAGARKASKKH